MSASQPKVRLDLEMPLEAPPRIEPTLPDEAELRRLARLEGWASEARYDRILSILAMVGMLIGWTSDYRALGATPLAFALLGLRALASLSALPLLLATFAAVPPPRLDRAKLLLVAGLPLVLIVHHTVLPTRIASQGWSMVATWAMLNVVVFAPPRAKLWVGIVTLSAYIAHLIIVVQRLGDAYGAPNEIVPVLLCAASCIFVLPWVPYRMEQQRFREFVTRRRLEREIELRTEHERALEAAKVAAQQAERVAKEQKARADAAAEEARQTAKKAAEEAQGRAELFANMSHDLRTPMAGILGLVELMRSTPLTEEQFGYIETIRASNQTLLSLLNDVIDFSRIEDGKLPLAPVPVPLVDVLRTPADLLRVTADRKGLTLRVDIAPGLPRFAKLDSVRVQQIVLNLLGNALKFTEEGTVTLRAEMRDWQNRRGSLRVEIEDTGIGFSEEQHARLFQRFRQAEDSTAQRFGGSGLGLSICKGLVGLMGGTIGATSRPGLGSLFWFQIPTEETGSPSGVDGLAEVPAMRVLLAEDNAVNQMVIGLMLKKLGQTVSVASDGRQALRMLTEQRFDIAIMDMQMPVIDGDEVTRRLRSLSGGAALTYVIALTASVTAEQQTRYKSAGVDAIYTKPIDMERLRQLLVNEGPRALARAGVRRAGQPRLMPKE